MSLRISLCLLGLILGQISTQLLAQKAQITESLENIPTYEFDDPSPIPILEKRQDIYPYFRFDGQSHQKTDKDWRVVTMENDYIKLWVLPEVGGKVWGAIEKSTGQEFLYKNKVLKFRDIAMRGPWTSGGLEFNFGYYGHTPTTSTPVDYLTQENEDGSVSCFIGNMDLHSRTQWRVEIRLPKDKAYFETHYLWYNPTPYHHSYYYWSNSAIKASDDLQFFYPGDHYIGHNGELATWPIDQEGRDLSLYKNNAFGPSKSYHILNHSRDYKGAYWHDRDFGMGHWSPHSDLPGQKLWLWAQSRSGAIWEDLLTDTDGQYVEVQAGRMFNQAALGSGLNSPFGQYAISPYQTDSWEEAWFPVMKTEGISDASPDGVLHSWVEGNQLHVKFMALGAIDTVVKVSGENEILLEEKITLQPLEVWEKQISVSGSVENIRIDIAGLYKDFGASPIERQLARKNNHSETPSALFHKAEQQLFFRRYEDAEKTYLACVAKDSFHLQAWERLIELGYQKNPLYAGDLKEYIDLALSIDTYNATANYFLGRLYQYEWNTLPSIGLNAPAALEAYALSSKDPTYRVASYLEMSRIYMKLHDLPKAKKFANKVLDYDRRQLQALEILAIIARKEGRKSQMFLEKIKNVDPLSHLARFELYLEDSSEENKKAFTQNIFNEFPAETILELGVAYHQLGLMDDMIQLFELAPEHPMIYYWLGYLKSDPSYIDKANDLSPAQVFPYRSESFPVLFWAAQNSEHWKPTYYVSLIQWGSREVEAGLSNAHNVYDEEEIDYAPFFHTRAAMKKFYTGEEGQDLKSTFIKRDFRDAIRLDPNQWRFYQGLSQFFLSEAELDSASKYGLIAYMKFPDNFAIGMNYAKTLLATGEYERCLEVLNSTNVLPFEGAREGQIVYAQANMYMAMSQIKNKKYKQALKSLDAARQYPENLGVGSSYEPEERLIDYLVAHCYQQQKQGDRATKYLKKVAEYTLDRRENASALHYLGIKALHQLDRKSEASLLLEKHYPNASEQWKWVKSKIKGDQTSNNYEAKSSKSKTYTSPFSSFSVLLDVLETTGEK